MNPWLKISLLHTVCLFCFFFLFWGGFGKAVWLKSQDFVSEPIWPNLGTFTIDYAKDYLQTIYVNIKASDGKKICPVLRNLFIKCGLEGEGRGAWEGHGEVIEVWKRCEATILGCFHLVILQRCSWVRSAIAAVKIFSNIVLYQKWLKKTWMSCQVRMPFSSCFGFMGYYLYSSLAILLIGLPVPGWECGAYHLFCFILVSFWVGCHHQRDNLVLF